MTLCLQKYKHAAFDILFINPSPIILEYKRTFLSGILWKPKKYQYINPFSKDLIIGLETITMMQIF